MHSSASVSRAARLGGWARREPTGGLLLGAATVLALVLANTPAADGYERARDFAFGPAALHLNLSLGQWTADGLLAVFFFVIGVELKREFVAGDLSDPRRALVPVAAAVGGVAIPVFVYLVVVGATGGNSDALSGWAVPAATDIAFALAVLAVVSHHLPTAMRTFLLTLAVVDDLIAITIIAVGYTKEFHLIPLGAAAAVIVGFALTVRRLPVWWLLAPLAVVAWALVHASGVHATVAGVLLGLCIPVFDRSKSDNSDKSAKSAKSDEERQLAAEHGPAARVEHVFTPWSSCVAVPLFAFFAAGVTVGGLSGLRESVTTPVSLAIIIALVVGKPLGITGTTFLVTRLRGVRLDPSLRWPDLVGVAMLGGIGFTVSLLVGELAFGTGSALDDDVKVGVLVGSLAASVVAVCILGARDRHYRRRSTLATSSIPPAAG